MQRLWNASQRSLWFPDNVSVWILPLFQRQGSLIYLLHHTTLQVLSMPRPYVCTDGKLIPVSWKDSMLSLYQDTLWREYRHARAVIRSIRILFCREDRCFWPAAVFLNPRSQIPEHDIFFRMLWHVPSVWIPHPGLPSVPSPSFPEPLHKPASARGNGPSRGARPGSRYVPSVPCSEPCQGLFPWPGSVCVWRVLTGRMWQPWRPYPLWLQWCFPNVLFSPCLSGLYIVHPVTGWPHQCLHTDRYSSRRAPIFPHGTTGSSSCNRSDDCGTDAQEVHRLLQREGLEACSLQEGCQYNSFKKDAKSCVMRLPSATSFQLRLT